MNIHSKILNYTKNIKPNLLDQKNWVKNQHYIPQGYLKNFCNDCGKLETFSLKRMKLMKSQSPESVCSSNCLYSLEEGKLDIASQYVENFFHKYEDAFYSIYPYLVDKILKHEQIENNLLHELCKFVVLSMFRSKSFKKNAIIINKETIFNLVKSNYKYFQYKYPITFGKTLDDVVQKIIRGENIDLKNEPFVDYVTNEKQIRDFENLLFQKKIRIYISNGERNFVTSDQCVIDIYPQVFGNSRIHIHKRIQYFVLSPKILIEFIDPNAPGKSLKINVVGKEDILFYNYLRRLFSSELYSCSIEDFNEEEYTEVFFNRIDDFYELYPLGFLDIKQTIEKKRLNYKGNSHLTNYEIMKI